MSPTDAAPSVNGVVIDVVVVDFRSLGLFSIIIIFVIIVFVIIIITIFVIIITALIVTGKRFSWHFRDAISPPPSGRSPPPAHGLECPRTIRRNRRTLDPCRS